MGIDHWRTAAICERGCREPNALFQGFYLGQETGNAFARVLFGDVNPSGKLPVTIPRSVGQLPVYYNHKPSRNRSYLWKEMARYSPSVSDKVIPHTTIQTSASFRYGYQKE